jgi:hypothetical protein
MVFASRRCLTRSGTYSASFRIHILVFRRYDHDARATSLSNPDVPSRTHRLVPSLSSYVTASSHSATGSGVRCVRNHRSHYVRGGRFRRSRSEAVVLASRLHQRSQQRRDLEHHKPSWVIEVEGTNSHPNPASWPGPLILRGGCSSTIPIVLPALDLHGARAHWHWRVDCWGERDNWASKARATVESWPLVGGIIGKPPTYFVMSEWFPQ